jgi:hypothetical protein
VAEAAHLSAQAAVYQLLGLSWAARAPLWLGLLQLGLVLNGFSWSISGLRLLNALFFY